MSRPTFETRLLAVAIARGWTDAEARRMVLVSRFLDPASFEPFLILAKGW